MGEKGRKRTRDAVEQDEGAGLFAPFAPKPAITPRPAKRVKKQTVTTSKKEKRNKEAVAKEGMLGADAETLLTEAEKAAEPESTSEKSDLESRETSEDKAEEAEEAEDDFGNRGEKEAAGGDISEEDTEEKPKKKKKKSEKSGLKKKKKEPKKGVVYINRPPAYMRPAKVQHVMAQYGEVTRIYLEPEDPTVRKSRKKQGGTAKIKYREGWIEFADRNIAKAVALSLNGHPVGGNRRNFHYSDLWSLKYLPGFRWEHLTEKEKYEKRTRKNRLVAEISQAKRENELFLEKVHEGKQLKAIIKRKEGSNHGTADKTARRAFNQRDAVKGHSKSAKAGAKRGKDDDKKEEWLGDVFG